MKIHHGKIWNLSFKNDSQFRELFDLAPDGIFIFDQDGNCLDVNKAACKMLGIQKNDFDQKQIGDFINPQDIFLKIKAQSSSQSQPPLTEAQLLKADGTFLDVEIHWGKLMNELWIALARNITERKQIELRLREEESRRTSKLEQISAATHLISEALGSLPSTDLSTVLQMILLQAQTLTDAEMGAVGIMKSPDEPFDPWVFTGVSEDLIKVIGHFPRPVGVLGEVAKNRKVILLKELSDDPKFQGLPAHHPPIHSFLGVPILFKDKSLGNIYLANKKNAKEFSVEDRVTLELLANRVSSAIEIAQHYKTESLGRSWLTGVIEQMPEAVIIADGNGKIIAQNRIALSMALETSKGVDIFGNEMLYDVKQPNGNLIAWEDLPLLRAIKEKKPHLNVELLLTDKNGKPFPILASATPMISKEQELLGAVVIFHDITILKQIQRLKEEWISVIAHDLRHPINVISMAAEILQQNIDQISPEDAQLLRMITTNAALLNRLIQDLLDASLIEAQRLSIQKEKEDIAALVENCIAHFHNTAPSRQVIFKNLLPAPCHLEIDGQRMHQVLNNLLSNAVKYSPENTPIEVALSIQERNVVLSITNEGIGLTKEQIANLFQRFYRAANADKATSGIGLGLYITKGLIEAHGGSISVESEPGKKTTFKIFLPI